MVTYLITREEYDNFCEELTPNHCNNDCVDDFPFWNFEATRYIYYLTHLSCKCDYYCECDGNRVDILKEATFWYIKLSQRFEVNEEDVDAPKAFVYKYLLDHGLVVN